MFSDFKSDNFNRKPDRAAPGTAVVQPKVPL